MGVTGTDRGKKRLNSSSSCNLNSLNLCNQEVYSHLRGKPLRKKTHHLHVISSIVYKSDALDHAANEAGS
uniref:Uncharacterized protein n=1 Tax=Timema bartmani TaxID=61472 RepID=A0A7R9EVP5_9NEOP|nr:unnamed protein product [Timema bartmani]